VSVRGKGGGCRSDHQATGAGSANLIAVGEASSQRIGAALPQSGNSGLLAGARRFVMVGWGPGGYGWQGFTGTMGERSEMGRSLFLAEHLIHGW